MTNWAYGITVGLTIASGMAMLMASGADRAERQAVQQRDTFVRLADEVERDAWELSDLTRLYVIEKQPETLQQYRQQIQTLESIENRLLKLKDIGASQQELALLHDGLRIADELQDEQQTAIDRVARGEEKEAILQVYGKPYEQELERVQTQIDHFRLLLEGRTNNAMQQATEKSRLWRTLSEAMVGLTALMFLFVLGFILNAGCSPLWYDSAMWYSVWHRRIMPSNHHTSNRLMKSAIWRRRSVSFAKMALPASVLNNNAMPTGPFVNCWRE